MTMTEFLVLLKLNPGKIVDTLEALRKIPRRPVEGVDLCYTMNIFGTWDVGVWFAAENTAQALDFVHSKIKGISGVRDVYTLPTFPHGGEMLLRPNPQGPSKKPETKTE